MTHLTMCWTLGSEVSPRARKGLAGVSSQITSPVMGTGNIAEAHYLGISDDHLSLPHVFTDTGLITVTMILSWGSCVTPSPAKKIV